MPESGKTGELSSSDWAGSFMNMSNSMASSRNMARAKRRLEFIPAAFQGEKFYLDLTGYPNVQNLERDILDLHGALEKFMSKDVTCVITNQNVTDDWNCGSGPAKSKVSGVSTPTPLSRGQALLLKSNAKSQQRDGGCNTLANARQWGIRIVHVNLFRKRLLAAKSKDVKLCTSTTPLRRPRDEKCLKPRNLNVPYIKFEDDHSLFRPESRQLQTFPHVYVDSVYDGCPFENVPQQSHTRENSKPKMSHTGEAIPNARRRTIKKSAKKSTVRPGYCEFCDEWYPCITKHIASDSHIEKVSDDSHFRELDKTILKLPNLKSLVEAVKAHHQDSNDKERMCLSAVDNNSEPGKQSPSVNSKVDASPQPAIYVTCDIEITESEHEPVSAKTESESLINKTSDQHKVHSASGAVGEVPKTTPTSVIPDGKALSLDNGNSTIDSVTWPCIEKKTVAPETSMCIESLQVAAPIKQSECPDIGNNYQPECEPKELSSHVSTKDNVCIVPRESSCDVSKELSCDIPRELPCDVPRGLPPGAPTAHPYNQEGCNQYYATQEEANTEGSKDSCNNIENQKSIGTNRQGDGFTPVFVNAVDKRHVIGDLNPASPVLLQSKSQYGFDIFESFSCGALNVEDGVSDIPFVDVFSACDEPVFGLESPSAIKRCADVEQSEKMDTSAIWNSAKACEFDGVCGIENEMSITTPAFTNTVHKTGPFVGNSDNLTWDDTPTTSHHCVQQVNTVVNSTGTSGANLNTQTNLDFGRFSTNIDRRYGCTAPILLDQQYSEISSPAHFASMPKESLCTYYDTPIHGETPMCGEMMPDCAQKRCDTETKLQNGILAATEQHNSVNVVYRAAGMETDNEMLTRSQIAFEQRCVFSPFTETDVRGSYDYSKSLDVRLNETANSVGSNGGNWGLPICNMNTPVQCRAQTNMPSEQRCVFTPCTEIDAWGSYDYSNGLQMCLSETANSVGSNRENLRLSSCERNTPVQYCAQTGVPSEQRGVFSLCPEIGAWGSYDYSNRLQMCFNETANSFGSNRGNLGLPVCESNTPVQHCTQTDLPSEQCILNRTKPPDSSPYLGDKLNLYSKRLEMFLNRSTSKSPITQNINTPKSENTRSCHKLWRPVPSVFDDDSETDGGASHAKSHLYAKSDGTEKTNFTTASKECEETLTCSDSTDSGLQSPQRNASDTSKCYDDFKGEFSFSEISSNGSRESSTEHTGLQQWNPSEDSASRSSDCFESSVRQNEKPEVAFRAGVCSAGQNRKNGPQRHSLKLKLVKMPSIDTTGFPPSNAVQYRIESPVRDQVKSHAKLERTTPVSRKNFPDDEQWQVSPVGGLKLKLLKPRNDWQVSPSNGLKVKLFKIRGSPSSSMSPSYV